MPGQVSAADEIEVTPEMEDAGATVLIEHDCEHESPRAIAAMVYQAMVAVQLGGHRKKSSRLE